MISTEITVETIVGAAALAGAALTLIGYYNKAYGWIKRQQEQDEKIKSIEVRHRADKKEMAEEQALIIYGLLAALKGLREQGCNGPVTDAINRIEKHLNVEAHKD